MIPAWGDDKRIRRALQVDQVIDFYRYEDKFSLIPASCRATAPSASVLPLLIPWILEEGEWVESLREDGTSEEWEPQGSFFGILRRWSIPQQIKKPT